MQEADQAPRGVLVMAYGTPATPADVEAYYTHVRRGRPPTPELLADLQERYRAIGGTSPLLERTRAQAAGIARALGEGWRVELGMKHAPPFLEDGVGALAAAGVRRAVGLVLAPHYSALSVGEYAERAAKAAAGAGIGLTTVRSWHLEPAYLELLAEAVTKSLEGLAYPPATHVLFTAHSLPARIFELGDPYPDQLAQTAAAVAEHARLPAGSWSLAWQSAGRTPEPWLGPDLLSSLRQLADAGVGAVLVCPAGFTSDHLEILYDLDVDAAGLARDLGLVFARTPVPNDHPVLCASLAEVVRRHA